MIHLHYTYTPCMGNTVLDRVALTFEGYHCLRDLSVEQNKTNSAIDDLYKQTNQ